MDPVALVVASAALQAAGSTLQKHRVAARVPQTPLGQLLRRPQAFFVPLLGDRRWLLGGALGLAGGIVGLQAVPLVDLSVLKALGRLETLLVVVAGVVLLGERLRAVEVGGLALLLAGALVLALHGGVATGVAATRETHLALVAAVLAVVLYLALRRPRTGARGSELALAAAAGLLFGTGDILVKGATEAVEAAAQSGFRVADAGSLAELAGTPEFLIAVPTYVLGGILMQAAFSVGRVAVIGAVMAIGSVALPIGFGLLVLGEQATGLRLAGIAAVALGTVLIARRGPDAAGSL